MSEARSGRRRAARALALLRRDQPLAPMTTIGTGGPARFFARVGSRAELPVLLAWAQRRGRAGVRARVGLEPAGRRRGRGGPRDQARPRAGGDLDRGRAPALRRRCAAAGGRGPGRARGPVGDRVRRQHPRHRRGRGADERQRLRRRAGAGARVGRDRGPAAATSAAARRSSASPTAARRCARGRSSPAPRCCCAPAAVEQVKGTLQEMRRRRHEAQPQGIRTFGSTFKNPEDPRAGERTAGMLLEQAGCAGLAVGGARFAPKHANFIENTGSARDRGRRRADGRGPPAGARALRRGARARGAHARSACASPGRGR